MSDAEKVKKSDAENVEKKEQFYVFAQGWSNEVAKCDTMKEVVETIDDWLHDECPVDDIIIVKGVEGTIVSKGVEVTF